MRQLASVLACSLAVALAAAGCVEKSEELTDSEKEQLKPYLLDDEPEDIEHGLEVSFEDKIDLLGYDLEPEDQWKPGQKLKVTWYWKVESALEEGWQAFTHVADASGADRLNHDGTGLVRRLYSPGRWKKGQIVKDVQEITLPADWDSTKATFYVGLWNGPHRLQVTEGPNDGENRVRAFSVDTAKASASSKEGEQPQPSVPALRARKAEGEITLDGKLDEDDWKRAPRTRPFVNTMTGAAAEPKVTAKAAWDDDKLYLAFEVADDFLKSEFEEHDDHLWEQDAVEVFVDPDGDEKNYFEMQVSPNGVVFDTRYDERRKPKPIGHEDWDSKLEAKVEVKGKVGDDKEDEGYTVEMAVPWKAFEAGDKPAKKPSAGETWRVNFYVMDARKGDDKKRAVAWSAPREGDFHVPSRFGRLVFFASTGQQGATGEPQKPVIPSPALEQVKKRMQLDVRRQPGIDDPKPGEQMPTAEDPGPDPTKQ